jgi:hypothetical protein
VFLLVDMSLLILAPVMLLGVAPALAQTPPDDLDSRIRVTASSGISVALADYETHGIAFPVRVGGELPVLRTGPIRHHLLLAVDYAHFSRSFVREPEVLPGVQLDVGTLAVSWRVFPFPRRGLHLDASTGVSLLRDRIRFTLPDRRVSSSETRLGVPLELGLGWAAGRVDVGLRYAHVAMMMGGAGSSALARMELVAGVRL